jgi:uncharacterized protein (DUF433 family)
MTEPASYKHIGPPHSRLREWVVKGTRLRAETLYRATVGEDPRTPEEVARDFNVSVEAVQEAVQFCTQHEEQLRREREEEYASLDERRRQRSDPGAQSRPVAS